MFPGSHGGRSHWSQKVRADAGRGVSWECCIPPSHTHTPPPPSTVCGNPTSLLFHHTLSPLLPFHLDSFFSKCSVTSWSWGHPSLPHWNSSCLLSVARGLLWQEAGQHSAHSLWGLWGGRSAWSQCSLFSSHRKPKETSTTLTKTLPGRSRYSHS